MSDQTPDPALAVACPSIGGCGVPAGTSCATRYGDEVHAERRRIADLRSLEHGVCGLCGRPMVRGSVEGAPIDAWHPDPAHHDCPPLADPKEDWDAYALAVQQGVTPGHPGVEHFIPAEVMDHVASLNLNEVAYQVEDLDTPACGHVPAQRGCGGCDPGAIEYVVDDGGTLRAYDPATDLVAVEVAVICPECVNGKHVNCDRQAYHPVTDELTPCTCTHGAPA